MLAACSSACPKCQKIYLFLFRGPHRPQGAHIYDRGSPLAPMYSFAASGMLRVGTPGNVFGIQPLPPDAKRDEADYFAVCGGGGSAKTGQFNSVVRSRTVRVG